MVKTVLSSTFWISFQSIVNICCRLYHSWCYSLLLKLRKRFSIETGCAAISQGSVSAILPMQHCTKENRVFPVKRFWKREFPFQDNLLWRKTEFPKFWHYRHFYRTSYRGRIKWCLKTLSKGLIEKKGDWFVLKRARKHVPTPQSKLLHGAAYNGWNVRRGGRKCVLGKHIIRSPTHLSSFLAAKY